MSHIRGGHDLAALNTSKIDTPTDLAYTDFAVIGSEAR